MQGGRAHRGQRIPPAPGPGARRVGGTRTRRRARRDEGQASEEGRLRDLGGWISRLGPPLTSPGAVAPPSPFWRGKKERSTALGVRVDEVDHRAIELLRILRHEQMTARQLNQLRAR